MANIAKNIRLLRTAQDLTQDQLAEKVHVTRQTVSNYENGKSQPDIDTIIRLAEALQADPNTLIYGIPAPPERKRAYVKTAIAVAAAILALVALLQEPQLKEMFRGTFNPYLPVAYAAFCKPFTYLMLGGALMQVLSMCFGLQPQVQRTVKIALLTVTGLWAAAALFVAVYCLWINNMYLLTKAAGGNFSSDDYWSIFAVPVLGKAAQWVGAYPGILAPVFLLPGAALWLFRLKKPKEAK